MGAGSSKVTPTPAAGIVILKPRGPPVPYVSEKAAEDNISAWGELPDDKVLDALLADDTSAEARLNAITMVAAFTAKLCDHLDQLPYGVGTVLRSVAVVMSAIQTKAENDETSKVLLLTTYQVLEIFHGLGNSQGISTNRKFFERAGGRIHLRLLDKALSNAETAFKEYSGEDGRAGAVSCLSKYVFAGSHAVTLSSAIDKLEHARHQFCEAVVTKAVLGASAREFLTSYGGLFRAVTARAGTPKGDSKRYFLPPREDATDCADYSCMACNASDSLACTRCTHPAKSRICGAADAPPVGSGLPQHGDGKYLFVCLVHSKWLAKHFLIETSPACPTPLLSPEDEAAKAAAAEDKASAAADRAVAKAEKEAAAADRKAAAAEKKAAAAEWKANREAAAADKVAAKAVAASAKLSNKAAAAAAKPLSAAASKELAKKKAAMALEAEADEGWHPPL